MTETAGPVIDRTTIAATASIHQKPGLAPLYGAICFFAAIALLLNTAKTFPKFEVWLMEKAALAGPPHLLALGLGTVTIVFAVFDHFRRTKQPVLPAYIRMNRALAYGIAGAVAIALEFISRDPNFAKLLLHDLQTQGMAIGVMVALSVGAYFSIVFPLVREVTTTKLTYRQEVERLRDSYNFVLGESHPEDWKQAIKGEGKWEHLVEDGLYANVLVFGGIGSGKTATVIYPLVKQALRKFPLNHDLTPSIVLLDLKGDNASKMYDFCKEVGREKDFLCIRPGNALKDGAGQDIIPPDRFLSWNPVGGTDAADVRSALLLEGLQATNDGGSKEHEYFKNVEAEFLSATLTLMDAVNGPGVTNLLDLYRFGLSSTERQSIISHKKAEGSTAQLYFQQRFEKMK